MEHERTYETILTERLDRVLRITLNRPEKRNALSPQLQDELVDAVRVAQYDKEVHAIVLRGAGPSFCAGFDIGGRRDGAPLPAEYAVPRTVEEDVDYCVRIGERFDQLWKSRIPVIAQVHGYCVAGGTDLALHCDMVITAEDAQWGFPPVRSQGGPPTHMWLYHTNPQWAKRLLLTGDLISGKQAADIGLALEAVPADQLDDHVMSLARRVSNIGRDLLGHNKRAVNLAVELMGRTAMQTIGAIHDVLGHNSPEAHEFNRTAREEGLRTAVARRDAPFA